MKSVTLMMLVGMLLATLILSIGGTARADDAYFDAPSLDNTYKATVANICDGNIEGLRIKTLGIVNDPANIALSSIEVEDNTPEDVWGHDQTIFTLTGLDFENVETKEQCEAFANPLLFLGIEAGNTTLSRTILNYVLPVKPEGFSARPTGNSAQLDGGCILVETEECKCGVGICGYNTNGDSHRLRIATY